jgi:hypothetical protein
MKASYSAVRSFRRGEIGWAQIVQIIGTFIEGLKAALQDLRHPWRLMPSLIYANTDYKAILRSGRLWLAATTYSLAKS